PQCQENQENKETQKCEEDQRGWYCSAPRSLSRPSISLKRATKKVHATPAQGFTSTTLAQGRFGDIDVFNRFLPPGAPVSKLWLSWQKTKGSSDGYVLNNVWQPGGSTGWHTHLGQTLVIVTAGAVTQYQGDDPSCTPKVYTAGMAFVDAGGDHVHIVRNEG